MISIRFEENNEPDSNPLVGPIERFTIKETESGLQVSPLKLSTYLLFLFLLLSAAFIFYMSFDLSLQSRPLVRVFLWAMGICSVACSYHVLKKGSNRLLFRRGGQFIEHLGSDGQSLMITTQSASLMLNKETVTHYQRPPYDQFKLVVDQHTLLRTKNLEYMNELTLQFESIGFKVNRSF